MPFLIGTDEAGYGPNLGPLVISASVWWVSETAEKDLYRRLKRDVCKSPGRGRTPRLAIADSKLLYSPAQGLELLERGVLAAMSLADRCPASWFDIWQMLDEPSHGRLTNVPWHENYNVLLPLAADREDLARLVPKLQRGLRARECGSWRSAAGRYSPTNSTAPRTSWATRPRPFRGSRWSWSLKCCALPRRASGHRVRQTRRAELLRAAFAIAVSRSADRSPRREPRP